MSARENSSSNSEPKRRAYPLNVAFKMLHVSNDTGYRWIRNGQIRVIRLGPRLPRIPDEEIERILHEGITEPAGDVANEGFEPQLTDLGRRRHPVTEKRSTTSTVAHVAAPEKRSAASAAATTSRSRAPTASSPSPSRRRRASAPVG